VSRASLRARKSTKTVSDLSCVDTNVLVCAHDDLSSRRDPARGLLAKAEHEDAALCVVPQVLVEFYAVVTSPRRVTTPRTPTEALDALEAILARPGLTLLPTPGNLVEHWIELTRRHPRSGQKVFDLQLVAALLANGVRRIYTFNRADFEPFEELEVLTP